MKPRFFACFICIMMVCSIFEVSAIASRTPEIRHGLGRFLISCSIYREQASFNGIKSDDSLNKVISVLGTPKNSEKKQGLVKLYYNGFLVELTDWGGNGNPTVSKIEVRSNEAGTTADGVRCGMSENILSEVYGTADNVITEQHSSPKLAEADKRKIELELNKKEYTYNADECVFMKFIVKKNVISRIEIVRMD